MSKSTNPIRDPGKIVNAIMHDVEFMDHLIHVQEPAEGDLSLAAAGQLTSETAKALGDTSVPGTDALRSARAKEHRRQKLKESKKRSKKHQETSDNPHGPTESQLPKGKKKRHTKSGIKKVRTNREQVLVQPTRLEETETVRNIIQPLQSLIAFPESTKPLLIQPVTSEKPNSATTKAKNIMRKSLRAFVVDEKGWKEKKSCRIPSFVRMERMRGSLNTLHTLQSMENDSTTAGLAGQEELTEDLTDLDNQDIMDVSMDKSVVAELVTPEKKPVQASVVTDIATVDETLEVPKVDSRMQQLMTIAKTIIPTLQTISQTKAAETPLLDSALFEGTRDNIAGPSHQTTRLETTPSVLLQAKSSKKTIRKARVEKGSKQLKSMDEPDSTISSAHNAQTIDKGVWLPDRFRTQPTGEKQGKFTALEKGKGKSTINCPIPPPSVSNWDSDHNLPNPDEEYHSGNEVDLLPYDRQGRVNLRLYVQEKFKTASIPTTYNIFQDVCDIFQSRLDQENQWLAEDRGLTSFVPGERVSGGSTGGTVDMEIYHDKWLRLGWLTQMNRVQEYDETPPITPKLWDSFLTWVYSALTESNIKNLQNLLLRMRLTPPPITEWSNKKFLGRRLDINEQKVLHSYQALSISQQYQDVRAIQDRFFTLTLFKSFESQLALAIPGAVTKAITSKSSAQNKAGTRRLRATLVDRFCEIYNSVPGELMTKDTLNRRLKEGSSWAELQETTGLQDCAIGLMLLLPVLERSSFVYKCHKAHWSFFTKVLPSLSCRTILFSKVLETSASSLLGDLEFRGQFMSFELVVARDLHTCSRQIFDQFLQPPKKELPLEIGYQLMKSHPQTRDPEHYFTLWANNTINEDVKEERKIRQQIREVQRKAARVIRKLEKSRGVHVAQGKHMESILGASKTGAGAEVGGEIHRKIGAKEPMGVVKAVKSKKLREALAQGDRIRVEGRVESSESDSEEQPEEPVAEATPVPSYKASRVVASQSLKGKESKKSTSSTRKKAGPLAKRVYKSEAIVIESDSDLDEDNDLMTQLDMALNASSEQEEIDRSPQSTAKAIKHCETPFQVEILVPKTTKTTTSSTQLDIIPNNPEELVSVSDSEVSTTQESETGSGGKQQTGESRAETDDKTSDSDMSSEKSTTSDHDTDSEDASEIQGKDSDSDSDMESNGEDSKRKPPRNSSSLSNSSQGSNNRKKIDDLLFSNNMTAVSDVGNYNTLGVGQHEEEEWQGKEPIKSDRVRMFKKCDVTKPESAEAAKIWRLIGVPVRETPAAALQPIVDLPMDPVITLGRKPFSKHTVEQGIPSPAESRAETRRIKKWQRRINQRFPGATVSDQGPESVAVLENLKQATEHGTQMRRQVTGSLIEESTGTTAGPKRKHPSRIVQSEQYRHERRMQEIERLRLNEIEDKMIRRHGKADSPIAATGSSVNESHSDSDSFIAGSDVVVNEEKEIERRRMATAAKLLNRSSYDSLVEELRGSGKDTGSESSSDEEVSDYDEGSIDWHTFGIVGK